MVPAWRLPPGSTFCGSSSCFELERGPTLPARRRAFLDKMARNSVGLQQKLDAGTNSGTLGKPTAAIDRRFRREVAQMDVSVQNLTHITAMSTQAVHVPPIGADFTGCVSELVNRFVEALEASGTL